MSINADARPLAVPRVLHRAPAKRPGYGLGRWELIGTLGGGDLTQVYLAQPIDRTENCAASYAVKLLRPCWQTDAAAIETVVREAFVGRQVTHPHLIPILAARVHEPPYFVVSPYLRGATLAQRLKQVGRPPLPMALWLTRQTAEALVALHAAGWMHADIKPSNLFVSPPAHITLLDLGFARRPRECGSVVDRCVAGTVGYMAPEMITSAVRPDIRSDLYSLGATLFEMLTGRLPFEARNLAELAQKHRQDTPLALRALAPNLPRNVVDLVRELLAKDPFRRPQTPQELVTRLAALEIENFAT
jgi:serine/threonine protein kinase